MITKQTTTCPSWCTTQHDVDGEDFHAGSELVPNPSSPIRLWQSDQSDARPGVVVAGQLLTEAQAHELGMALVRAADVLRRAR